MGKFKVGDRVVEDKSALCGDDLVDHWNRYWRRTEGELTNGEFVVTKIVGKYIHYSNREGGSGPQIDEMYLKPATWQPKVGDRVRFTDKCLEFWWFGPHTKKKEGVIAGPSSWPGARGDFQFDVIVDGESDVAYVSAEHIEPLPVAAEAQPAVLTITAGKFYRTRDGRKVGPMVSNGPAAPLWPWYASDGDYGNFCRDDGTVHYGDNQPHDDDLIAEWVDEPVAVAATASNDNAAPAKFDFKVGDKAKTRDGRIVTIIEVDHQSEFPFAHDMGEDRYHAVEANGKSCIDWDEDDIVEAIETENTVTPASTTGFTIPIFDTDGAKLVKTKNGYGFEIARFGNYAWIDTGQTAPITLKVADIAA